MEVPGSYKFLMYCFAIRNIIPTYCWEQGLSPWRLSRLVWGRHSYSFRCSKFTHVTTEAVVLYTFWRGFLRWIHWRMHSLQWRHNEHNGVSKHHPHHCLLNRLFGRTSKKTSKLHVTGLCAGNSSGTGEFPTQMASNAENVSIWWRHHRLHGSSVEMTTFFVSVNNHWAFDETT